MRLKDNNNPFIHVNPPYQLMVIHSSKLVYPRELYQRGVERKRVELIAAHFNEYVANEPKVSFRNGQFIVTDGQHTIEGRILRNGGKDLPILCKVYTGMTVEQEALLFAEQNGFSAPLTAGIKLRAKVVGGDAISKAFLAATNRVGLSLNYDSQQLTDYRDITAEVSSYFEEKMQRLQEAGVQQVILDPGFGFAKTVEQNYELLARMHRLTGLGCPLLAGISRKSMIYKVLDTDPADALTGTTALHWECLRQGAAILRVHDTREAVQVVRLWRKFRENS